MLAAPSRVLRGLSRSTAVSPETHTDETWIEASETLPGLLAVWCAHRPLNEPALQAFTALVQSGLCQLPEFGLSDTWTRFRALGALSAHDLELSELVENHANARSILEELGQAPAPSDTYGLWTSGPISALLLEKDGNRWVLRGRRPSCSGAFALDRALVLAEREGSAVLVLVARSEKGLYPVAATSSQAGDVEPVITDVVFEDVRVDDEAILGEPGFYFERPGFWHDATAKAALWWGASVGIGTYLRQTIDRDDPHGLAHFGAVRAKLASMRSVLENAAREIDDDPYNRSLQGSLRTRMVRYLVATAAREVLSRASRAVVDMMNGQQLGGLSAALSSSLLGATSDRDLEALGRELFAQHLVDGSDFL